MSDTLDDAEFALHRATSEHKLGVEELSRQAQFECLGLILRHLRSSSPPPAPTPSVPDDSAPTFPPRYTVANAASRLMLMLNEHEECPVCDGPFGKHDSTKACGQLDAAILALTHETAADPPAPTGVSDKPCPYAGFRDSAYYCNRNCPTCGGSGKVGVPDESAMPEPLPKTLPVGTLGGDNDTSATTPPELRNHPDYGWTYWAKWGTDEHEKFYRPRDINWKHWRVQPQPNPPPSVPSPIPMVLTCPSCGARHIDEGEFATKIHHTHSCQSCGLTWRPAVVPTVGVRFLPGFKNDPAAVVENSDPDYVPGGEVVDAFGTRRHP